MAKKRKNLIIDESCMRLGFDTSSDFLSIALSKGDRILKNIHLETPRDHLAKLLPMIDEILNSADTDLAKIDVIVVGVGPGSYTGIRIGVATALGLVQSLDKKIIGLSSLAAIIRGVSRDKKYEDAGVVCAVVDAKRKEVYASIYRQGESDSVSQVLDPTDLGNILKRYEENIVLAGDGLVPYGELLKKILSDKVVFAKKELWYPIATDLISLSLNKRATNAYQNVSPIYLRKSEAEERLKRQDHYRK